MRDQFPDDWRQIIVEWAQRTPCVASVYLFGSRAKECASEDSDIDLAYLIQADGGETPFTIAMFNGRRWQAELQAKLPRTVDLQYAEPADDVVVWPAVLDHGVKLYGGGD